MKIADESPNRTGNSKLGPGCIVVYGGHIFDVRNPAPESIRIDVIAHQLSMDCRFGGAVEWHYSVAQHLCYTHDLILQHCAGLPAPRGNLLKMALLHDGAEFAFRDCQRPLKCLPEFAERNRLEDQLQDKIFERFGVVLNKPEWDAVKAVDNSLAMAEAQQLIAGGGQDWEWGQTVPAQVRIAKWSPECAKAEFLKRFDALAYGMVAA